MNARLLLLLLAAAPVRAEEKLTPPAVREVQQNDRVRVAEVTYQPGEGSPSAKRPMRVVYAIHGGLFERTYEDGKKETSQWKTGETRILNEPRAYALKNVGQTVVRLLVVYLK